MSRQLDYYYRKGKAARAAKRKAQSKAQKRKADTSFRHYIKDKSVSIHRLGILQHYVAARSLVSLEDTLAQAGYAYSREKDKQGKVYWASQENNTIFYFLPHNGLLARLTTQSITVWLDERTFARGELEAQEAKARQELRQARQELAQILRLSLKDEEEVVSEDIAFVDDYFARKWKHEGNATLSIKDKEDNKERRRIDVSIPGHPEYEFTHRRHARQDALIYDRHVEQITEGVWNIDKQLQFNQQALELVAKIHEELKVHRSAYLALEKVAKKLDRSLSQRKLIV
jgi:hypothetical protein